MNETTTVWVLHLNRYVTFVCGPYVTLELAVAAGGGRIEDPALADPYVRVRDGLLVRLDGVPTISLREQYAAYLAINPVLLRRDGTPYSDEDLDRRFPSLAHVERRLAPGRKLTAL